MKFSFVVALALCSAASVFAQSAGVAGISGVVKDQSGAVVPNAKVVIASTSQGTIRTVNTNSEGIFTAPVLTPGPGYDVKVSATGFSDYDAKDLVLQVGQTLDLRISLTVGQTATQVDVDAIAPMVEDTKTDISQVVDSRQIQDLPINGRRVDSFVLLTPAVSDDGNFGLLTFRGVAGQNTFLVDGTDTTDQFYNENAGRTRIASQISQDAVQEFQVVSSNYSAEYGRAMGGIVNTVTRSGGNQVHGSGFWYYRSTGFNARDPFSTFVPSEKRQQAGATIGGPIVKDKLFFFLSTEVTRRNFPMVSSLNTTAVSPTTQTWNQCGVASGTQPAATPAQCAAINALLPRFYGSIPRQMNQELGLGKLDYRMNDRNSLTASFNFMHMLSPNGIQSGASSTTGSALTSNGDDAATVRNGHVAWTAVPTSTFVNELRYGIATDRQWDGFDSAELGQGLGYLQVSVNGTTLGPANYLPRTEPMETRNQFQDNATWTKGKHTLKFGADIATTGEYVYFISNAFGSYTYQTVNAFALDYSGNTTGAKNWQRYVQTFGNGAVNFRMSDLGFYGEDQWRLSERLTLQLGLRYEKAILPQPTICNHDYPLTCQVPSSSKNFEPRLGLTYRLNAKTVLQAGYGMFHARFQGGTIDNLFTTGNGLYQTAVTLNNTTPAQLAAGPVFPNALASQPTGGAVSAASLQFMDPHLKTPYSEQGNIGIQRQITSDVGINVSYIWSRGLQLYGIRDLNLPAPSTNFTYTILDTSGNAAGTYTTPVYTGSRPDTRYGGIFYAENGVNSYYNGLAVQVNKRFAHGFQALLSYTWSHEIDDGQSYGESTNNLFLSNANYWTFNGNYKFDKGSGTLDQRHRGVLSWVWAPTTHRTDVLSRWIVNGWQLSSITSIGSGHPYGTYQVSMRDTPVPGMISSSSLNGLGFSFRAPFIPYNNYYLPALYKSDARLTKSLPLGEKVHAQLIFEVFNIANTWAARGFTSSQAYTEQGGKLTPTPTQLYIPSSDAFFPDGTLARRMQIALRVQF